MNSKKKILYIDDEPTNLLLFKIHFQKKYGIITGLSGLEGLELLRANPDISIVVSDMKMPGMNGVQFIKAAKNEFPNIVFYILTGFDITEEIAQAIEDKLIFQYFSKPFNVTAIDNAISSGLNQQK